MIAEKESDENTKSKLLKLAEKIRFSDPMSNEKLVDLETIIFDKVKELKTAPDKQNIITEINMLLDERNKKCKIYK